MKPKKLLPCNLREPIINTPNIFPDVKTVRSQDNSVGTVKGYWPDGRGSILGRDKRVFSSLQRPDRL
jgi:hypothetical protein